MTKLSVIFASTVFSSGLALQALAEEPSQSDGLPVWEVGAGIGALWLPHYPGADQSQSFIAPFPLLIYRGDTIRAERGGIRGIMYESENTVVDLSIRGSLPVNSEDNRAREGMADLDPTLEIGPQITYTAYRSDRNTVQLRLPLRAAISVSEDGLSHEGNIANPNIRRRLNSRIEQG